MTFSSVFTDRIKVSHLASEVYLFISPCLTNLNITFRFRSSGLDGLGSL